MGIFTDNLRKVCLMAVCFLLLGKNTKATIFTAVASGNFNSALTWGGVLPGSLLSTDAVIIPAGITVTLTGTQTFSGTSSLAVNGTLTAATGSALIITSGSLSGVGSIAADSMALGLMSGLTFTGNIAARKLTSLGANVATATNITVSRLLTLSAGTMNVTAGALTMGNYSNIVMAGGALTATAGLAHLDSNYDVTYTTASATTGLELTGAGLDSVTVNVPGSVTLAANQTMNGMLTLAAGTFALNGHTLTFGNMGNLSATGTGSFMGSTSSSIIVNTTASLMGGLRFATGGNMLNNLTINTATASTTSLASDLAISGLLTLNAGTLALNGNTLTLNSTGDLAATGTGAIAGSATSSLVINTAGSLTGNLRFTAAGSMLNNLTLNTGAASIATLGSDLTVNGMVTLTAGALSLNGHTLAFNTASNLAASGAGTITGSATSNLIINTAGSLTGALRFTTGGNMLNNLTLNTGAATSAATLGNDLTIGGTATMIMGTLALNGHTLTFGTAGSIATGGAGSFTGSATSNIVVNATAGLGGTLRFATGGNILNNLTINTATGSTTSLGSDLIVNGTVMLTSGMLALNGNGLTIASTGDIATAGTGTITGSSLSNLTINSASGLSGALYFTTGSNMLNNLTVNTGAASSTYLGMDVAVNGMLTLTAGTLALNGHTLTLGNAANLSATGAGTITGSTSSNLVINTTGSLTGALRFATGANTLSNLTLNMGTGSSAALGTDLNINGLATLTAGSLSLSGHTLVFNTSGDLSAAGTGNITGSSTSSIIVNATAGLTGALRFATGGNTINNLTVNTGTTGNVMLGSDLAVSGMVMLTAGTLSLNGHGLTLNATGDLSPTGTGSIMGSTASNLTINASGSLSSPIRFGTGGNMLNNFTLSSGGSAALSSDLAINGLASFTAGTLALNGHTLTFNSGANVATTGAGTITGSASSVIVVNATGGLTGGLRFAAGSNVLHTLTVNTGAGSSITLESDLNVNNALNLQSGKVKLGNTNLMIAAGGMVNGGTANSYVMTNGTGKLTMNLAAGASDTFKVGNTTNFAPMVIAANSGSANGAVSLNVANGVLSAGTTGTLLTTDQPLVNATWNVSSTATTGINYNMVAMWTADMEVNSFHRANAYISHYMGGAWDVQPGTAAGVSGSMYTMSRTGITSLSPFMVADRDAVTTAVANVTPVAAVISVYPNPATSTLYFSGADATTVAIYDMNGRLVKTADATSNAVSIAELPSGTYFAHFNGQTLSAVEKFVKQ